MEDYTDKLRDRLNALLEKSYDAEKGYHKAAEHTDHAALKTFFMNKSKERYDFGHQIKAELHKYGQKPDKGGSATGTAHRTWMDIKSWFSSNDDEAMLEEAIRGETAAVEEYKEVLAETSLPQSTRELLEMQKNSISHSLSSVKRLEDLSEHH